MKKIAKIVLCGWVLCALLGGTGARAAQEPKLVTVQEAVARLEKAIKSTDQPALTKRALESKLEARARSSADGKVDFDDAVMDLNKIRAGGPVLVPERGGDGEEKEADDAGPKNKGKIVKKTADQEQIEEFVGEWLPGPVTELVGDYLRPARWNVQFEPGQESKTFMSAGHKYYGPRASRDGRYLAFRRLSDQAKVAFFVWDMLKMEEDKALFFEINAGGLYLRWDISPEGDAVVYQQDNKIIYASLRGPKDKRELDTLVGLDVQMDDGCLISFSSDGKAVFGYEPDKGKIVVWNAVEGGVLRSDTLAKLPLKKNSGGGIAYDTVLSPGAKKLAVIQSKTVIEIWDLNSNSLRNTIHAGKGRAFVVESCVFDGESNKIALIASEPRIKYVSAGKRFLEVWDLVAGVQECDVPLDQSDGEEIAFSPDGVCLALPLRYEAGFRIFNLPVLRQKYGPQAAAIPAGEQEEKEGSDVLPEAPLQELAGESDEDMPPLEDVPDKEEADEKEDAALPMARAPGMISPAVSRRITAKQAQQEFVEPSTDRKRSLWAQGLRDLAANSTDKKINYEEAWQLYEEIKSR